MTPVHVDEYAPAGNRYAYFVRAYDFAGNRSADSNMAEMAVEAGFEVPEGKRLALDGGVEAEQGYAA